MPSDCQRGGVLRLSLATTTPSPRPRGYSVDDHLGCSRCLAPRALVHALTRRRAHLLPRLRIALVHEVGDRSTVLLPRSRTRASTRGRILVPHEPVHVGAKLFQRVHDGRLAPLILLRLCDHQPRARRALRCTPRTTPRDPGCRELRRGGGGEEHQRQQRGHRESRERVRADARIPTRRVRLILSVGARCEMRGWTSAAGPKGGDDERVTTTTPPDAAAPSGRPSCQRCDTENPGSTRGTAPVSSDNNICGCAARGKTVRVEQRRRQSQEYSNRWTHTTRA